MRDSAEMKARTTLELDSALLYTSPMTNVAPLGSVRTSWLITVVKEKYKDKGSKERIGSQKQA